MPAHRIVIFWPGASKDRNSEAVRSRGPYRVGRNLASEFYLAIAE